MEIAPIPGIRFNPVSPRPLVAGINAPLFDIVDLAGIGSDVYEKYQSEESREGMQNEEDEQMLQEEDDYVEPLYAAPAYRQSGRHLNFVV